MNATVNMTSAQSGAKIRRAIKSVSAFYGRARDKVQEAAIFILQHAENYGDCRYALQLVKAVPQRNRKDLIDWFSFVSPLRVTLTKETEKVSLRKETTQGYNPFDLEKANAHPWYEPLEKPEKETSLKDVRGFIEQLEKYLKNTVTDSKVPGFDPDSVELSKQIVEDMLHGLEKIRVKVAQAETESEATAHPVNWGELALSATPSEEANAA